MTSIWLDTDPGFDDWLTMLMLAAHPRLHWLGISVVAGNAPLAVAAKVIRQKPPSDGRGTMTRGCWRGKRTPQPRSDERSSCDIFFELVSGRADWPPRRQKSSQAMDIDRSRGRSSTWP